MMDETFRQFIKSMINDVGYEAFIQELKTGLEQCMADIDDVQKTRTIHKSRVKDTTSKIFNMLFSLNVALDMDDGDMDYGTAMRDIVDKYELSTKTKMLISNMEKNDEPGN